MLYTTIKSKSDGFSLDTIYCEAENPKGVLQLCHGMCEYKERYIPFMEYMAENGFTCWLHDMRGHGKSINNSDDLGYFEGDKYACIDDLKTINELLHEKYPGLPVFLFGHSMGSLEVRVYTKLYDSTIDGLIVCGCPSPVAATPAGDKLVRAMTAVFGEHYRSDLLNKLVLGAYNSKFVKESPSKNNWLSRDRDNVIEYDKSPLCGFTFTTKGFCVLMEMMLSNYTDKGWNCTNPGLPIFFISGQDDPCRGTDEAFQKAIDFMKNAGYKNITYKLCPELRHEILNEKDAPYVKEEMLNFLIECLDNKNK